MSLDLVKETLRDVKKIFLIVLVVFLIVSVLTALFIGSYAETLGNILAKALSKEGIMVNPEEKFEIPSELAKDPDLFGLDNLEVGTFSFAKTLFIKNSKASAAGVVLGLIPFLFLPVLVLLVNAAIIGGVYQIFIMIPGANVFSYLVAILPHGIIEIPALLLGISMGILLCRELTRKILGTNKMPVFERMKGIVMTFVLVVLPLLIVAALIESFITPSLMMMSL